MSRNRNPDWQAFAAWSDRVERTLRRSALILVAAVLLIQGALQIPAVRSWLSSADRLEGIPYEKSSG